MGGASPRKSNTIRQSKKPCLSDYQKQRRLGQGAHGDVYLVTKRGSNKKYALKQIEKQLLAHQGKYHQALIERQLLDKLDHPGIVKMEECFQDTWNLYFVLELCEGGQFREFIEGNVGKVSDEVVAFYVGEIVNILEYLQGVGVVHRDIKPENLLLGSDGHLKLADFGTAEITECTVISEQFKESVRKLKRNIGYLQPKIDEQGNLESEREHRSSFVGTLYYLAPELVEQCVCSPASDIWALGCILYQLYFGKSPFFDTNQLTIYQKIRQCEYLIPQNKEVSPQAIDLIKRLLVKNPDKRLGGGKELGYTFTDLKNHVFFKGRDIDEFYESDPPKSFSFGTESCVSLAKTRSVSEQTIYSLRSQSFKKYTLICGLVERRRFLFYFPTYLTIYEDMSVQMSEPNNHQRKRQQKLQICLAARMHSPTKFSIETKDRRYIFKVQNAAQWVNTITGQFVPLK